MAGSLVRVASVQARQDSSQITLGPTRNKPAGGGWDYGYYNTGGGAAAAAFAHAAAMGASGGGGTKGQWTNNNTVTCGATGYGWVGHRRKPGFEWGSLRSWWENFELGIGASGSGYSGAFRFNIPTPAPGATLKKAWVTITGGGTTTIHSVGAASGTFEFSVPPYYGFGAAPSFSYEMLQYMGYWPRWYYFGSTSCGGLVVYSASLALEYDYSPTDDDCKEMDATEITWDGAQLHGGNNTHYQWGEDSDQVGAESETGTLSGLKPDTWYWYRALSYCETKLFHFKTKKEDTDETWQASIITLPATEVWATGATMHGLFKYKGNSQFYVALGWQYGLMSDLNNCELGTHANSHVLWMYTLGANAKDWGVRGFMYPMDFTIAGLLPDRTYYYRACLHLHNPNGTLIPMTTNNFYGETLSFGGPVSIFGHGWEYVTAKKAEDDVSKLSAGRYYMDKAGDFVYESAQRRLYGGGTYQKIIGTDTSGFEFDGGNSANTIWLMKYAATINGECTGITTALYNESSGNFRLAIYDDVNGEPVNLLGETADETGIVGENTYPLLASVPLEVGVSYWLAIQSNAAIIFTHNITGFSCRYKAYEYATFPITLSGLTTDDNVREIYLIGWGYA